MRCEYIYRLSYNIYVYYVHKWNAKARRSAPSAPLGPSDEVLTSGLHDTTKKHARTHSLFLITRGEEKNEHSMFLRYSGEGIERKQHGRRDSNLFVSCLPKTLHPLSTRTSSD